MMDKYHHSIFKAHGAIAGTCMSDFTGCDH